MIKIKKKLKNIKAKELITFIFSMISIILYIKGLEGCVGDEVFCLERMGVKFFQKIVLIILFSCSIVSIILTLITFRKLSFFHLDYIAEYFLY